MKIAEKFGRLLVRFWPAWLPLLLLFVLPWARPFSRVLWDEVGIALTQMTTGQEATSSMPPASAHPADFDLQLWNSWYQQRNNYRYDYSDRAANYETNVQRLRKKFPDEPLLFAPPIQHEMGMSSWMEPWYNYGAPASGPADIVRELKALRTAATRAQRLEPDNAFWWVALAHIEWRAKHYEAAMAALERAAKCSRYDDHSLDLARRLIRVRQRYGAPSFFDKLKIIEDARGADGNKLLVIAQPWSDFARRLRTKGDNARALRWAGAILVVGDLMQRDSNSWPTARAGIAWQNQGYNIGMTTRIKSDSLQNAHNFARFARANKRPDLAQMAPQLAMRSQRVQALSGEAHGRYGDLIWLQRGKLDKGLGATTTLALVFVGLGGLWFILIDTGGGTLTFFVALMGSLAAFAFCGAPFVLALGCALLTLRRYSARFNLAPRLDTELALAPPARALLRWFLPVCALATVALFVASWALWLLATARGWGTIDLLKLLPPDRNGATNSLLWDSTGPPLLVYSAVLCVGCLLIWFWRWRWGMPADLRPFTQGALRWWKESLGVAIVALSWIFLVIAVASLPLFNRTEMQLEHFLKVGELEIR